MRSPRVIPGRIPLLWQTETSSDLLEPATVAFGEDRIATTGIYYMD
jgi:hypothetical protein